MRLQTLFVLGLSFFSTPVAATSIDYLGHHQLAVNASSPTLHTSLPFSSSATGIGGGGVEPYGEFTGEQPSPLTLHFTGAVRNGAHVQLQSSISFTLDEPTLVRIAGWATLLDGDGVGPADFDARVQDVWQNNELIFFTTSDGAWTFDEFAMLEAGWYSFHYSANAPQVLDQASYDFILTIPEPSSLVLVGAGLIANARSSRRGFQIV